MMHGIITEQTLPISCGCGQTGCPIICESVLRWREKFTAMVYHEIKGFEVNLTTDHKHLSRQHRKILRRSKQLERNRKYGPK